WEGTGWVANQVVEFICGFTNNSIGLMSDACHMLFDNASITIGIYAAYVAQCPATRPTPLASQDSRCSLALPTAYFWCLWALGSCWRASSG
ncbi:hypothetical protein CYMTET_54717, partial [Cymbomonas tetramitiformis]